MNLSELRSQPHLSASSVSDYLSCGLKYRFSRIDKLRPEFKPEALVFGSGIHAALAEFYRALQQGGPMTVKDLKASFQRNWVQLAEDQDDIMFRKGKNFRQLLADGKNLLEAFHQEFQPEKASIIGIEEPFRFEIPGLDVPMIGAYDLVLEDSAGVITIVDHKTAARAPATQNVDANMQMTIYHMAARENGYADREILLRLDYLIKTKIPQFDQFYTIRSKEEEDRAKRKILAVWDGIRKSVFIPNDESWKCQGCQFKRACQDWFKARSRMMAQDANSV